MTRRALVMGLWVIGGGLAAGETGVTDTRVLLGQPAAFSGPSAGLGIEMWRGATAAFSTANDAGGVEGRKIQLVLADDAYDADRAVPAVNQLVTGDKVFALFGGVGTPTIVKALPVVLEHFKKEGLFYFANFTGAQPQREPPYDKAVFNVRASYREETDAIVNAILAVGRRKIGTFVQDDAYGQSGRDGVKRALKLHGLDVVADTIYPRGQKFEQSNRAQIETLKAAGAEAIIAVGSYQACAGLIRDARNAGLSVPIHNVSFVGADQMLYLLRAEEKKTGKDLTANLINTQVVPSYLDDRVPLVLSYRAAMEKYAPTVPQGIGDSTYKPAGVYSFGSFEGYVSAKVFLQVLRKAGRNLTRKGFYDAAEQMGKFEIGLGVPAEFGPTRHQALDKVWFTFVTPGGWATTRAGSQ